MLAPHKSPEFDLGALDLDGVSRLARIVGAMLKPGDAVTLRGEIGAGKTEFARFLIRAAMRDAALDVPSPAYALQQTYDAPSFRISHFDFYRLRDEGEAGQLGVAEALAHDVTIIEWPERAGAFPLQDGVHISFAETGDPALRRLTLTGCGRFTAKAARIAAMFEFLGESDWRGAGVEPLTGDASARVYYRLRRGGESALLMDWPRQPDGPPIRGDQSYSDIARLAVEVRRFADVAEALREAGAPAPEVWQADYERGLLIVEDFGDGAFQSLVTAGADPAPMWRAAVDALVALRAHTPPAWLQPYDHQPLGIEVELLVDWYAPQALDRPLDTAAHAEFVRLWDEHFTWLSQRRAEHGWVLRDFHSPNLIWRDGAVGVIDFQDALIGHRAYDLVSLLQDARLDLPMALEDELYAYYLQAAQPADAAAFRRAYATLGAQRASKILGIFVRLNKRDGKPAYLRHIPRIERYLACNLEHPALAGLKDWHQQHTPHLFHGDAA
jgi:hypothetical protein